jgi:hypothetical protein
MSVVNYPSQTQQPQGFAGTENKLKTGNKTSIERKIFKTCSKTS